MFLKLQQHLAFTVLKRQDICCYSQTYRTVATAPTVYGIETATALSTSEPR